MCFFGKPKLTTFHEFCDHHSCLATQKISFTSTRVIPDVIVVWKNEHKTLRLIKNC